MVQGAKLIDKDVFQISNKKYAVGDAVYFDPGVLQEDEKTAVDEHIPSYVAASKREHKVPGIRQKFFITKTLLLYDN